MPTTQERYDNCPTGLCSPICLGEELLSCYPIVPGLRMVCDVLEHAQLHDQEAAPPVTDCGRPSPPAGTSLLAAGGPPAYQHHSAGHLCGLPGAVDAQYFLSISGGQSPATAPYGNTAVTAYWRYGCCCQGRLARLCSNPGVHILATLDQPPQVPPWGGWPGVN